MADPARYPIEIFPSDEDEGFIAVARDLPGCSAFGRTQTEAATEIQHAIKAWKEAAEAANNPIPEPSQPSAEPLPSGRILLRLPRTLHAAVIETANRENVSLNQQIVSLLSAAVAVAQFSEIATRAALVSFPSGWATRFLWPTIKSTYVDITATTHVATLQMAVRAQVPHQEETVSTDEVLDVRKLPAGVPVILGR